MPHDLPQSRSAAPPADWEVAYQKSERRFRLLVDGATNFAMFLIDKDGCVASWNAGAQRILGYEEAEVLGRHSSLIFTPEDRANGIPEQEMSAALREGRVADVRWHLRKDRTRFFADGILERLTGDDGAFDGYAKVLCDATEAKRADDALRASEERLQSANARLEAALVASEIGICTIDVVQNRVTGDATLARFFSLEPDEMIGVSLDVPLNAIHEEDRERAARMVADALASDSDTYSDEYRVSSADGGSTRWLSARAKIARDESGAPLTMFGAVTDITERVKREQRERFLNEFAERSRVLADPDAIIADAVRSVGEFLKADRCVFSDINLDTDTLTILADYCASDAVVSMVGVFPMSAFGAFAAAEFKAGRAVAVDDVRNDSLRVAPESIPSYEAVGIVAHLAVPSVYSQRTIFVIGVHSGTPRRWLPEETDFLRTVVERTWLAAENARLDLKLRAESEQRREQGEYLRRVLESSPDCIKTLDLDGHMLTMTEGGQAVMEVDDFSVICGLDWRTFWQDDTRDAVIAAIETAKAGGVGQFQGYCPTVKGSPRWWDVIVSPIYGADGKPEQLLGISRDITQQKQSADRERARLTSIFTQAPAFMAALHGPQHIFDLANPPYYQLVGHRDILGKPAAEALPEVVEQGFIGLLDQVYQSGKAFVGSDFPILLQVEPNGPLEEHFVDFTYQPLFDADGVVSGVLVHGVDLTARKQLEQERERLLDESRDRAKREALLNQIGVAVRATLEPDAILNAVVSALGQGLGADRCYIVRNNVDRDTARVYPEWYREDKGLAPLEGRTFQMSAYITHRDPSYSDSRSHVMHDANDYGDEEAEPLLALNLRSRVRVPIEVGNTLMALCVAMAWEPRQWTREEVSLIENVAALVHAALEIAHVQQRERNIAQQLQEALQPTVPTNLPGLALASYYRPALAEASVGGDFFDVFNVEPGHTALVVADLSGKGLAAASQVATVRNMLRYALYSTPTLAEAVTGLHRALETHRLLTGFATLIIGIYDENERTLSYVNCGQEPGLIWHAATNTVEQMLPTGPVLGGFGDGDFEERTAVLASGDILALFTDGLTEVGPSRKVQLEIDGVSNVLRNCCVAETSELTHPWSVVECLIAGVDDFARGGARDDIALLVGVVA